MTLDLYVAFSFRRPHLLAASGALKIGVYLSFISSLAEGPALCNPVLESKIAVILRLPLIQISGKRSEICIDEQDQSQIIGDVISYGNSAEKHGYNHQYDCRNQQEFSQVIQPAPSLHKPV